MVSVARTTQNIEITAETLQEELHRLEAQRQALERELAAVVAHLGSVQTALGALQNLIRTAPTVKAPATETTPAAHAPAPEDRAGADEEAVDAPRPTTGAAPAPSDHTARGRGSAGPAPQRHADDAEQGKYGRLTEQILEYLAATGTSVRARDVAAALGRDTDSGSINAVRSTLDRLVGTSRVQRAGRGLYRANPS
ncbi:hypothetical protein B9W62_04255 [Streptomyces sp. CS113]|uniref:hypothetical protein n=1 Tax=Streptomyces sp. CS113 TaxID=1982761 RepID=UPI000B40BA28|nr:hypothetical protein [Streptomyces sp. CS113]OWA13908.1 hypothetical protein B9W62_04255 [Streptomyces sp. CS113]